MKIMKKNKLYVIALMAIAVLFSACSSSDSFEPGPQASGEQVYFPNDMNTQVELSINANTFAIPVYRVAEDAATVQLNVKSNSTNFTFPTNVSFAEGQKEGALVVSYDPNKLVVGQYDTITVSIPDGSNTPYGLAHVQVLAGVSEPWTSLGTGTFADYGWMKNGPYPVEIQQSQLYPEKFRVVKPYTGAYVAEEWTGATPGDYLTFYLLKPGDVVGANDITITQENLVYFEPCMTGYYVSSYDATLELKHPADYSTISKTAVDESFLIYNEVYDYQDNGLPAHIYIAPMWYMEGVGSYSYWDSQYVEIVFPGVADYSCEVAYNGKYTDADDNVFACANVTLSADVASAKLGLVQGKSADAINSEINALIDGTDENAVDVAESGEYKVAFPEDAESDNYTLVVVTFDEDGEAQDYNYAVFKYTAPGATEETFTPAYVGTYTYTLYFGSSTSPYDEVGLTLSQCDQNPNKYRIEHVFYDVNFDFIMNEDGTITFDDQFTGYTDSSYGEIYVTDMHACYPEDFPDASYYSNGTFNFNIGYYCDAGFFNYGFEKFVLTGTAAKAAVKSAKKKSFAYNWNAAPRFRPSAHVGQKTSNHMMLRLNEANLKVVK